MNSADWHLQYERERRADLVRTARRHDLAARVLAAHRGRVDALESWQSRADRPLSPRLRALLHH